MSNRKPVRFFFFSFFLFFKKRDLILVRLFCGILLYAATTKYRNDHTMSKRLLN